MDPDRLSITEAAVMYVWEKLVEALNAANGSSITLRQFSEELRDGDYTTAKPEMNPFILPETWVVTGSICMCLVPLTPLP
jgi:hypothetical protein